MTAFQATQADPHPTSVVNVGPRWIVFFKAFTVIIAIVMPLVVVTLGAVAIPWVKWQTTAQSLDDNFRESGERFDQDSARDQESRINERTDANIDKSVGSLIDAMNRLSVKLDSMGSDQSVLKSDVASIKATLKSLERNQ